MVTDRLHNTWGLGETRDLVMYTQKEKEKRYNDLLRATSNMCDTLDQSRQLIVETESEEQETNNVDTEKEITVEIQDIDQNEDVNTDLSNNLIFQHIQK